MCWYYKRKCKFKMVNLKNILKLKDRSISYLVRKTGIARYSLDLIVQGKKSPTIEEANKISEALGETIENIFFDKSTNTINSNSFTDTEELINDKKKAS